MSNRQFEVSTEILKKFLILAMTAGANGYRAKLTWAMPNNQTFKFQAKNFPFSTHLVITPNSAMVNDCPPCATELIDSNLSQEAFTGCGKLTTC